MSISITSKCEPFGTKQDVFVVVKMINNANRH